MSYMEIETRINKISDEFTRLIESVDNFERKKDLFKLYYETLITLNEISIDAFKYDKKLSKIID